MQPRDEQELSDAIRAAKGGLRIVGGGTRSVGHIEGALLQTDALSGITLYEPGALTLVARAGTPLPEVEAALAAEGQRLPFEPSDMRAMMGREGTPSIGGMVAANASGPRRVQAGACRDSLIGVRFVDGAGRVIKNGGRVMKNVTGYDLVKLMAGSWGTLGVLSECCFKLLPVPETEASLLSAHLPPAQAVDVMSRALGTPYEVTGAARRMDGRVVLRVEGFAQQVAYRLRALQEALGGAWDICEGDENHTIWRDIRDVRDFAGKAGDVWRISVRPSDAPDLVAQLQAPVVMDWGGGLIWALMPQGVDLRAKMGCAGHATLVRSQTTHLARFHPEAAPVAAISQGLRTKFDPRAILNTGLMG